MADTAFTASIPIAWIVAAFVWIRDCLMPSPLFLWVSQGVDMHKTPNCSWLHLNVRVKRGGFFWKTEIPDCEIWLHRYWGTPSGEGINMRWRSPTLAQGERTQTLVIGRAYSIPVAWRDENDNAGTAYITNQNWLQSNGVERKWPLPPETDDKHISRSHGVYEFDIEIRGIGKKWRSPHRYVLIVPPPQIGNGHFAIEARCS